MIGFNSKGELTFAEIEKSLSKAFEYYETKIVSSEAEISSKFFFEKDFDNLQDS